MLDTIFDMQLDLQTEIGYNFEKMDDREKVAYIKEYALHAEHELHEMLSELPYFKPWSKRSNNMSESERCAALEKAKQEYVDFFHIVVNLALALGLTYDNLFDMYIEKNKVNFERQESGY